MKHEELKKRWLEEEQYAIEGWDFSHLQFRWQHGCLGWDYKAIMKKHLFAASQQSIKEHGNVLDLEHRFIIVAQNGK
ncbi:hypothetical protein LJC61_01365 [Ruminococcaceae bacterium OttesenSCG-928-A16]|nr:hypothetical protein [Ruminococcaceae bacterium OttesenSCG-928-A16]